MAIALDLIGQRFGRLIVVKRAANKGGRVRWKCLCDCGSITIVSRGSIRNGKTKSCGCLKAEHNQQRLFIDMTGQRFGRLMVIEVADNVAGGFRWLCKCDCGNMKVVPGVHLRKGSTTSCGCYRDELRRKVKKDLAGQRFNRLFVVKRDVNKGRQTMWRCLCDCGNEFSANGNGLTRGAIKSCGCLYVISARARKFVDLTGRRFGRLQVVEFVGWSLCKDGKHRSLWRCICDCGEFLDVYSARLIAKNKQSCGCLKVSMGMTQSSPVMGPDDIPYELAKARMGCLIVKRKLKELSKENCNEQT